MPEEAATTPIGALPAGTGALALDTYQLTKRFGTFTAMDSVTMRVEPGTVHALLGENGAGKSTLVKCVAGFQRAEEGSILIDGREQDIANPIVARALGIGMVYQHFTLAPGMTVAENLLLAGGKTPALIDWKVKRAELQAFLATTPFSLDLDVTPSSLAAGEKQKLELLKQLYLKPRLLILDEPTSVLTPQEADEVLGHVRAFAQSGMCTVLIITHKFREVMAYADSVTVLRRGKAVKHCRVADTSPAQLAASMMGEGDAPPPEAGLPDALGAPAALTGRALHGAQATARDAKVLLQVDGLVAQGDRGTLAVHDLSLQVRAGEILGVAGVSGNGQRELVEALVGQRPRLAGKVTVRGEPYLARREENRRLKVRSLPEEPLRNACVGDLSVAENMALRDFDQPPLASGGLLRFPVWRSRAREWIAEYGVKTQGEGAPIRSLSGGNVQRAVLARELAGDIDVLIAANPVFGLDFAAVAEIHSRIMQVREKGGAVLLISEDIDELLELADRIVVMSEGRIVYETDAATAERHVLGAHMGGGDHGHGHHAGEAVVAEAA
ncbi:ABC transporter ATP-binding protein [Variovorax sp. J22G21]|uniref:ABC transporter ATP-binding protein n=1 Tax=Variovorax fucosicus TaxID=3053517 RepID=UPI0025785FDF|nr:MULTISPECIES: ABC transporter ATP-binding protein [unclassified Variovorax]MDM0038935.1 ABC transporter ATP-binding protein [Variovorax sp. J22R193]MDM0063711.1 ABC transporter ATP-binding protein [Variovorax sp. J22G21]